MLRHWFVQSSEEVRITHGWETLILRVDRLSDDSCEAHPFGPDSFAMDEDRDDPGWWIVTHGGGELRFLLTFDPDGRGVDPLADSRLWILIKADPSWRVEFERAARPRRRIRPVPRPEGM